MSENISKNPLAQLEAFILTNEEEKVANQCKKALEDAKANKSKFNITRGGKVGFIEVEKRNGCYAVSIQDETKENNKSHHDYLFDTSNNTLLFTNYILSPYKAAYCTKYVDGSKFSLETMVPNEGDYYFTQEEQDNARYLMFYSTPFMREALPLAKGYTYQGDLSIGKIIETICKDNNGFNYRLGLTPHSSHSCGLELIAENGKARIICYSDDGSVIDYETFLENNPFDDTALKFKISILSDMGFDLSDVPKSLKPEGKGQK